MSDKSITPRDARHISAELHMALRNANVPPPYILVGHSWAACMPESLAYVSGGSSGTRPGRSHSGTNPGLGQEARSYIGRPRECTVDDERSCEAETLAQAGESLVPPNVPVFLIHVMFPWGRHPFPSKDLDEIQKTQMPRVASG
jgi:hypothetical protein